MKKILILEDEFAVASAWREALEVNGHHVIHVMAASEAIDALSSGGIDVFICDMLIRGNNAQVGNSGGLSALSYINLHVDPRPLVIAVSGAHPQLNVLRHAQALKADVTLVKPIAVDEILEAISSRECSRE